MAKQGGVMMGGVPRSLGLGYCLESFSFCYLDHSGLDQCLTFAAWVVPHIFVFCGRGACLVHVSGPCLLSLVLGVLVSGPWSPGGSLAGDPSTGGMMCCGRGMS